MRFEGLDLNLLVALEVLLDCRSTTETARRLHLSQPTISAALGRLRHYFNDELLMNVGRDMVPTAKGEELAPAITELLNVARFKVVHADEYDPLTSRRRFKMLCSDFAFDVLVSRAIAKASKLAPAVTFEIGITGPEGTRQFLKGDIDLMITVQEYHLEDHPVEDLFSDEDSVICWSEGKFADGIDAEQFLAASFAVPVFGEERRPTISDAHFRTKGINFDAALQVSSFSALPRSVIGTDRIAIMHKSHARLYERSYPITVHDLPIEGPGIREVMQWHRLRHNDKGISWLRRLLLSEVHQ
jgi:LysR family transcriptional regulator, nod-box dependent transcriptional activator